MAAKHFVFDVTVELPAVGQVFAGWFDHHELDRGNIVSVFEYAASYLTTPGAYNVSPAELEFRTGPQASRVTDYEWGNNDTKHTWPHLFLQDALPDNWGRGVLTAAGFGEQTRLGTRGEAFLLLGTPDAARQGALRLWVDGIPVADGLLPNAAEVPWLELTKATASGAWAQHPDLVALLAQGTGIGGACPKLTVTEKGRPRVVKLPRQGQPMSAAHEWVAMQLAHDCGIRVPPNDLKVYSGHAVLLLDRFDRVAGSRFGYASARTLRGWVHNSDYGSYEALADLARIYSQYPEANCRELFIRMVFSTLIGSGGNILNHGFLRVSDRWVVGPAFGLRPSRGLIGANEFDHVELCDVAPRFLIGRPEAQKIVDDVVQIVRGGWEAYAEQARSGL